MISSMLGSCRLSTFILKAMRAEGSMAAASVVLLVVLVSKREPCHDRRRPVLSAGVELDGHVYKQAPRQEKVNSLAGSRTRVANDHLYWRTNVRSSNHNRWTTKESHDMMI